MIRADLAARGFRYVSGISKVQQERQEGTEESPTATRRPIENEVERLERKHAALIHPDRSILKEGAAFGFRPGMALARTWSQRTQAAKSRTRVQLIANARASVGAKVSFAAASAGGLGCLREVSRNIMEYCLDNQI